MDEPVDDTDDTPLPAERLRLLQVVREGHAVSFVIFGSTEDVHAFQRFTESVADHFGSDQMAEHYLNGFIDWDGNPTEDDEGWRFDWPFA